ncbi:DUF7511 domain-containing protein [Halomontanus rarus]|uniref:DUF7511 domain-containing protein n=1 Tax=Halomontanus rarus TaxID=3034020 RepID=UPI00307B26D9
MSQTEDNPFDFDLPVVETDPDQDWFDLVRVVIHNSDAPDELALADPRESGTHSAWITAQEGSFVSLEDSR